MKTTCRHPAHTQLFCPFPHLSGAVQDHSFRIFLPRLPVPRTGANVHCTCRGYFDELNEDPFNGFSKMLLLAPNIPPHSISRRRAILDEVTELFSRHHSALVTHLHGKVSLRFKKYLQEVSTFSLSLSLSLSFSLSLSLFPYFEREREIACSHA